MPLPRPVALLARDAQHILARVSCHATIPLQLERRAVTLETLRHDHASKVYRTVEITRTVDPRVYAGEIGDRQLEQQSVPPVEIRLPSSPRPHHRSEEHTSELQSRPHLVCRL